MTDVARGSGVWGQQWLEAVTRDPAYDDRALSIGERVARVHTEPDVRIGPGRLDVTVSAGPRTSYAVVLSIPTFDDLVWNRLLDHLAVSPSRAAAIMGGALDPSLASDLRRLGVSLLPEPGELRATCDCNGWTDPCKHIAGAIVAVADAIDDDPMILLAVRGRDRRALANAIESRRSGSSVPSGIDEMASTAWLRIPAPLPAIERRPEARPGTTPSWGVPPASAPFTADGLEMLGTDMIHRASDLLDGAADSALDLDPISDLARLASRFSAPASRRRLAELSGVSSRELTARARAWERAGADGVRAHVHPAEITRIAPNAQLRRIDRDGRSIWFRFEKESRRWVLASGPSDEPESLLSPDPVD
jgi:uncharacterized Zn finger protein